MERIVAFDEAGNSGGNLLDRHQPIFVLASVSLSDEDAARLLPQRDREYKFSVLKRSARGRQDIIGLLDSDVLAEDRYLISGFHKPFMAITKMVDLLVEPLAYRDGVDLYERGANLALSNMLYFCLPAFLGRRVFDTLVERFVGMVRSPSERTIQRFYQLLQTEYRKHGPEAYASDLAMLFATRVIANDYICKWDSSDLDPAIPAFVEHASVWTGRHGGPFRIVHDMSKPIANEQVVLEAIMSATDERVEIGYDRRKMVFPIAAREIELLDSSTCTQLQVADILAGGSAHCLKTAMLGRSDDLAMALLKTRVLSGQFRRVWPELKVSPEELGTDEIGGIDAIEHMGAYVRKRLGRIPPKGQRRKR